MPEYKYTLDKSLDEVVDEQGNVAIMLRKLGWNTSEPKVELRKWFITEQGERPSKGVAFCTPEGPGNLAKALIRNGFGHTNELISELKGREDFDEALAQVIGKQAVKKAKDTVVKEYFDPREALQ